MNLRSVLTVGAIILGVGFAGCAKQTFADKPIDQIKKEVETMSVADLEANARLYAGELRAQKAELDKLKAKMQALSVDKIFADKALTKKIKTIGQTAEALFDRYTIYAAKLQEKGGDVSKVKLD